LINRFKGKFGTNKPFVCSVLTTEPTCGSFVTSLPAEPYKDQIDKITLFSACSFNRKYFKRS